MRSRDAEAFGVGYLLGAFANDEYATAELIMNDGLPTNQLHLTLKDAIEGMPRLRVTVVVDE